MAATPTITLSGDSQAFLGSTEVVDVTFSNSADSALPNATGYAPFVVLSLDKLGANGGGTTGVTFAGATYLGAPVDSVIATFDSNGNYAIPKSNDGTGQPIVVHGSAGNQVALLTLPFGSFTAGQTPLDIKVSLNVAAGAKIGGLLPVSAQGGFLYGTSERGDTNANPTLITPAATISFNPTVFTVTSIYNGPEAEIAAGPSNIQSWKVLGTLANSATVSDLTLVDRLPSGAVPTEITLYDGNGHTYIYAVDSTAGTITALTPGAPVQNATGTGAGPWIYFNAASNTIKADFGDVTGNGAAGPSISTKFYTSQTQSLGSAADVNPTAGADLLVTDELPFGAVADTLTVNSANGAFVYKYDATQAGNATHGVSLVSQGSGTTAPAILTAPGATGANWVYYDAAAGKIVSNFDGLPAGGVGAITASWTGGQYQLPGTISKTYTSAASNSLLVDQLNGGTTSSAFTVTNGGVSYVYDVVGGVAQFDAAKSSPGAADIGVLGSAAAVTAGQGVYFDAANARIYTNLGSVAANSTTTVAADFTGAPAVNEVTGQSFFQGNDVAGLGSYTSSAYGTASVATAPPSSGGIQSNLAGQDFITAKPIALQKTVSNADGLQPGGHLSWTLNGEVSNYADIANLVVTDSLGDGQYFDTTSAPTLVAVSNGVTVYSAALGIGDYDYVRDPSTGITTIHFKISDQLAHAGQAADLNGGASPNDAAPQAMPASFKIGFGSVIDDGYLSTAPKPSVDSKVEQGDSLGNSVVVTGTLVNSGAAVSDNSAAGVTIPVGAVSKSIYQVNGAAYVAGQHIQAGDNVTYRLTYTLPITRADNVTLTDFLPLPVFNVDKTNGTSGTYTFDGAAAGTTPGDGVVTWAAGDSFHSSAAGHAPTVSVNPANNQIQFNFGAVDNAGQGNAGQGNAGSTIDLLFTTKVLDKPFIDDLKLTNQVTSSETNSFGAVAHDNAIVQVRLGQPVLNVEKGVVSSTGLSQTFSGTKGPISFGAAGSAGNSVTAANHVTSAKLAATPLSDRLSGAQGGDVVRFTIAVENTGHGPDGAFDIVLHDVLPNGYVIPATGLHLTVTDGNGVALNYVYVGSDNSLFGSDFTKDGIELTQGGAPSLTVYDPNSGSNIAIVTYDLQVAQNIPEPNDVLVNTATVSAYSAVAGGANFATGPSPGNLTAQTTVITHPVHGVKTVIGTSETAIGATPASIAADIGKLKIGETVTFQVTETFGEGTLTNVVLHDVLDNSSGRFIFQSGSISAIGGAVSGASAVVGTALVGAADGKSASLALGSLTVSDDTLSSLSSISYTVTATYAGSNAANVGGQTLVNNANVTATNPNNGGTTTTGTAQVTLHSAEPELVLAKTVRDVTTNGSYASVTKVNATDHVQYDLKLTNTNQDGHAATAYNIDIKDLLALYGVDENGQPNVTFDVGSVQIVGGNAVVLHGNTAGDTIVEVTAGSLDAAGAIEVTFTGVVSPDAVFNATIPNTASFTAHTLPTTDTGYSTPGLDRVESGTSSARIVVASPVSTKALTASSDATTPGTQITIGETATYTITTAVPKGDDTTLTLVDTLPPGFGQATLGGAPVASGLTYSGYTTAIDTAANTVTYSFSNVHATAAGASIVVSFNATLLDVAGNRHNGQNFTNTVKTYTDGTLVDTHTATGSITLGSLSGHVWLDQNADGVQAVGIDANQAGRVVTLYDSTNTAVQTTTTDAQGAYLFGDLKNGSYYVKVTPPSGDEFSPKGAGANPALDSIVDLSGTTTPVAVTAGNTTANQNAAYYVPAALGDKVFTDANANGSQDVGDSGIAGLTVTLLDGQGALTDGHGHAALTTQTTDTNGLYHFTDLRPGTYEVQFTKANGDHFTAPFAAGTSPALDSNANVSTGITPAITLTSGQTDNTIDAGIYTPVTVSGTVFTDLNDNGVKDIYDTGLGGIEVDLLKDGVKVGQTTTNPDGTYSFADKTPGTYAVKVINSTPDVFSPVGANANPALDSIVSGTGSTAPHTLQSGDSLPNQNAGLFPPQPGLTIHKQQSVATVQSGDIVTYTVTVAEAAGNAIPAFNVSIADLLARGETLIAHSETVKGGSGGADTIVESGTGFTVTAPQLLAGDQPFVITYQARIDDGITNGQTITNTANLGYDSAPRGGLHDTGSDSQTLTGHLVDQFAKSFSTATTSGTNVAIPGQTITFDLTTTLARGAQGLVISDVLPQGLTAVSAEVISEGLATSTKLHAGDVVAANGSTLKLDFGTVSSPGGNTSAPGDQIVVRVTATVDPNAVIDSTITNTGTLVASVPGGAVYETDNASASVKIVNPGKITGMVFLDGNCNGIYHSGDPGIAGVMVRLLDKDGHATGIVTTTDSYGQYSFNKLIPGQYEVQVVAPQGTGYSGEQHAVTNPLLDSDVSPTTGITEMFTVGAGLTVPGINAGLEFNGYFGGVSPNDIGHGMFLTNGSDQIVLGHGGNNVSLGAGGGDIVILDGHGLTSTVEINGVGDDIVTSCGPLIAQTQTSGSGYLFAGQGGSSTLNGGPGNAYLMGAGSNDLIFGGAGHNVIIGGGSTGVVITSGGVVTGYTDGDREIAGGVSTQFIYQRGDGVVKIDGGLRMQDSLEITGYAATDGQLIKVGGLDALYFGGNDLIVFYGASPYVAGATTQVSYTSLPGQPDVVVVFDAHGKPSIVASGSTPVPPAPAPLAPAIPTPGGAPTPLPAAPSSQAIVLSGANKVFDFTKAQTSANVDTTITGSQGFATITLGNGDNTVTSTGYGNVVTAGAGRNHIAGGDTYQKVTVGSGDNDITTAGYTNVITAGDGDNIIHAGSGGDTVTVGQGNNVIVASGWLDVIKAGNGDNDITSGDGAASVTVGHGTNTIVAGGYNNHIVVGDGHNTITAGDGGETVDLGAGSDTVTLAGWSNLLIGGLGHATVLGGTSNVFQIEGVGTTGGLDVMDFGPGSNDVLDLSKLLAGITLTPSNVASYVNVTGAGAGTGGGTDTQVAVDLAGSGHFAGHIVATLHGAGASSLTDLQSHAAIRLG